MASAVPRLFRNELTKQWARDPAGWSPHELLAGKTSFFPTSSSLTVKRSQNSRFFMYEEHANQHIEDSNGPTEVLQGSPSDLADLLLENKHCYHYWTSPVADVAPGLSARLQGYESLYDHDDQRLLDPRGPSLWMGSSGSGTQAHYDVANNVIVQLFGTKRVRCYPPGAASSLYVFPDAHPRARKSQVNFDEPDHARFPQFASLQPPVLDVVLRPGDALRIPAFWFHHVENGRIPMLCDPRIKDPESGDGGPTVSLNMFALSLPMMTAQGIFRNASRPFGVLAAAPGGRAATDKSAAHEHYEFSLAALRALGWALLEGLGVQDRPDAFIRASLLESRYAPLGHESSVVAADITNSGEQRRCNRKLTAAEEEAVAACVALVLPEFAYLKKGSEEQDVDEIVHLVALHLLELWAVELVGAKSTADAWDAALLLED